MKKLAILSIVAILLLSGCTNKVDESDQSSVVDSSSIKTNTGANAANDINDGAEKIDVSGENTETMTSGSASGEANWCAQGNKITASEEEFTIAGIVSYKGQSNICKAEKVTNDGSSTIYYNEGYAKNGSNQFVEVIAKGKNASASARAIAVSDPGVPGK